MKFLIYSRLYQYLILVYDLSLTVQFYCSDLNNLKGNSFIFLAFSVRALIPLQIKDNIIHKCRSFLFPLSASIMYSFCMVNLLLQDVAVTPFTAVTEFL